MRFCEGGVGVGMGSDMYYTSNEGGYYLML